MKKCNFTETVGVKGQSCFHGNKPSKNEAIWVTNTSTKFRNFKSNGKLNIPVLRKHVNLKVYAWVHTIFAIFEHSCSAGPIQCCALRGEKMDFWTLGIFSVIQYAIHTQHISIRSPIITEQFNHHDNLSHDSHVMKMVETDMIFRNG